MAEAWQPPDVSSWHKATIRTGTLNGRYWSKSGHRAALDRTPRSQMTQSGRRPISLNVFAVLELFIELRVLAPIEGRLAPFGDRPTKNKRRCVRHRTATFDALWQFTHMPRFYFDIREGADLFRDEEGMEFPDLASAEREAEEAVTSLIRKLRYAGKPIKITIEVRDETGTRLTGASATFHVERGVAAVS